MRDYPIIFHQVIQTGRAPSSDHFTSRHFKQYADYSESSSTFRTLRQYSQRQASYDITTYKMADSTSRKRWNNNKKKNKHAATTANTNIQVAAPTMGFRGLMIEYPDLNCDMFATMHHEATSAIFQLKDGINGGRIPSSWLLLDSQSTAHVFSNSRLLKNIHEVAGSLTIHTQTGTAVTKLQGYVQGIGAVWYHPGGIANILSLALILVRTGRLPSTVEQWQHI